MGISSHPEDVADIVVGQEYPANEVPKTVIERLQIAVEKFGSRNALAVKTDGAWKYWTYKEYYDDVCKVARAFLHLGLDKFHAVSILGFNSREWFLADLGAIFAGGLAVGIYTTNSPDACWFVANDSRSQIIVVEDAKQLKKILQIKSRLPLLKAIIQYRGAVEVNDNSVYSWEDFLKLGEGSEHQAELQKRMEAQAPGNCCTLIYTSGTTGDPKGVMLSHDNVTWTVSRVSDCLDIGEEHLVSYLPLSHVAAQMLDIHLPIFVGGTLYFAQPDALKGSLVDTLKDVRPTIFLGVPRVWEKIQEKMKEIGKQSGGVLKSFADYAKTIGLAGNQNVEQGLGLPWGFWFADTLVFYPIRRALGLDRCKIQLTGAAPVSRDTINYFMSINLPLYDIFGMSESSAVATACYPGRWKSGTCGQPVPGIQVRIDQPDANGDGEIQFFGRNIMMGYLGKPEKTLETLTQDGWLRSGDVGRFDSQGFMSITGRIKELIITAGGENVAPVPIEDDLKAILPLLSNCMLVGDKRKFLTILVTLKCSADEEGHPTDKLTRSSLEILHSLGSSATTVTEAASDPLVLAHIEQGIKKRNDAAVSNAQKIQKFKVLPVDFAVGFELGPTLKLKRQFVSSKYAELIDSLYEGGSD